jgi:hypothetical protein
MLEHKLLNHLSVRCVSERGAWRQQAAALVHVKECVTLAKLFPPKMVSAARQLLAFAFAVHSKGCFSFSRMLALDF